MKVKWSQLYRFNARLGLIPFLGGVPYLRYLEYPLAAEMAGDLEDKRILDIGSGRRGRFPLFLLTQLDRSVIYATDIMDYREEQHLRARKLGLESAIGSRLRVERQDATSLTYPDAFFDRVFAISTIEHIEGDGDTRAMVEIARVLDPGGLAVIAVPFDSQGFVEVFRKTDVWFRHHPQEVFFEKRYDLNTLHSRLIRPSGLALRSRAVYGEPRFRFWDAFYSKILPLRLQWQWLTFPFRLTMPLWASMFMSVLDEGELEYAQGVIFAAGHTGD